MKTIIVVGGGASGLMAAVKAAGAGAAVTVLEHNERPGRKLLATGNGKCNLTNMLQEPSCYHGSDPDFVWERICDHDVTETLHDFSEMGISFTDRDGWIYPVSMQASAVLDVLLMQAAHLGARIKTRERVTAIRRADAGFRVDTEGWSYPADAVIVACGSPASEVRGASGCAAGLLSPFGAASVPYRPSLAPLKLAEKDNRIWAGSRVRGRIRILQDGISVAEDTGELQMTAYGISGIPAMQVSRAALSALDQGRQVQAELRFLPEMTEMQILEELETRRTQAPYKSPYELLIGLLPDKIARRIAAEAGEGNADDMPGLLAERILGLRTAVTGTGNLKQAQVASGGILTASLTERMEVRGVPGLFVAGECADADGACGGYNLQWAWSSGAIAGTAAAEENM